MCEVPLSNKFTTGKWWGFVQSSLLLKPGCHKSRSTCRVGGHESSEPHIHPAEIVMLWTGHILLKALHIRQKRKLHHTRLWYKTC